MIRCPVCASPEFKLLFSGRDWEFGSPGLFYVLRCLSCGTRWTWPPMSPEELAARYPADDYYAYRGAPAEGAGLGDTLIRLNRGYPPARPVAPILRALARTFRPWLDRRYYGIPRYVPAGRLLDVGAGAGDFLTLARRLDWEGVGIEADTGAAARAREAGLNVVTGDAGEVLARGNLGEPFDLVRFHHSLEHLGDPAGALRAAAALTRPGGKLLVAVPNCAGVPARLFGRYWYHWSLPFHRFHYDARTLGEALSAAGWIPTRYYCVSYPPALARTFLRWLRHGVAWRFAPREKAGRLSGKALRPVMFLFDFMKDGDNLVVEATLKRKTGERARRL